MSSRLPHSFEYCYRRAVYHSLLHCPRFLNFLSLAPAQRPCGRRYFNTLNNRYWRQTEGAINNALDILDDRYDEWLKIAQQTPHTAYFPEELYDRGEQNDPMDFLKTLVKPVDRTRINPREKPFLQQNTRTRSDLKKMFGLRETTTKLCDGTITPASDSMISRQFPVGEYPQDAQVSLSEILRDNWEFTACTCAGAIEGLCPARTRINKPQILCLSFNRTVTMTDPKPSKLIIQYPENLDLRQYHGGQYILRSVIMHIGSLESGHHLARVKEPNGIWSEVDGEWVEPLIEDPSPAEHDYVLIYTLV